MQNYQSFARSVLGKSHEQSGTVLQDSSFHIDAEGYTIIAVADGHGDVNFTRSDKGSRMACEAAHEAIQEFVSYVDINDLQGEKRRNDIVNLLCRNILLRWDKRVEADYTSNPFTEEEVTNVREKYRVAYLNGERCEHAYGTTLQVAIITPNFFLAIRNGDGECVVVDKQGNFTTPIPENDQNEASFVTSLCDDNAIDDFRYYYSTELPSAVLIGSDGVENSYTSLDELFSLYRNVCRMVGRSDVESTAQEMEKALSVLTARGSGDDVSVAAAFNIEDVKSLLPAFEAQISERNARLEAEELNRQRTRLSKTIAKKVDQLQKLVSEKNAAEDQIEAIEERKRGLISELRRITGAQEFAEEEKKNLESFLPTVSQQIEDLTAEISDLQDKLDVTSQEETSKPENQPSNDSVIESASPHSRGIVEKSACDSNSDDESTNTGVTAEKLVNDNGSQEGSYLGSVPTVETDFGE